MQKLVNDLEQINKVTWKIINLKNIDVSLFFIEEIIKNDLLTT